MPRPFLATQEVIDDVIQWSRAKQSGVAKARELRINYRRLKRIAAGVRPRNLDPKIEAEAREWGAAHMTTVEKAEQHRISTDLVRKIARGYRPKGLVNKSRAFPVERNSDIEMGSQT